jgi:hypothetical protein
MKATSWSRPASNDGVADATALDHRDLVESHYPEAEYVLVELDGFVEIQGGEPDARKSLVGQRIILIVDVSVLGELLNPAPPLERRYLPAVR